MIKKVLLWSVAAFILGAFAMGLYEQASATCKASRVPCQNNTTTFERIYKKELIASVQKALRQGNSELHMRFQEASYMEPILFERVTQESISKLFKDTFEFSDSGDVSVDVLVYENDKKDPGKKSKKAFLYAGYFAVGFSYKDELVYKVQVDFMDDYGADMKERIECVKASVMSL